MNKRPESLNSGRLRFIGRHEVHDRGDNCIWILGPSTAVYGYEYEISIDSYQGGGWILPQVELWLPETALPECYSGRFKFSVVEGADGQKLDTKGDRVRPY
jgi:hypothetical protein